MADDTPNATDNTPGTSPESPSVPVSSPPANTGGTVPNGTHADNVSRNEFNEFGERITAAITELTQAVTTIVNSGNPNDETPVKRPWTAWGSK